MITGYFCVACSRVMDDNVEVAGAMMSFLLSLGLGLGSVMSFILVKLVL